MNIYKTKQDKILQSLERLLSWIKNVGYKGYDPYDIWENRITLYSARHGSKRLSGGKASPIARILRGLFYYSDKLFPEELRDLLSVKKRINAKGMGLFASAYFNLYHVTGQKNYINKSCQILDWLMKNGNNEFGGIGWGYPFHWQSSVYIPHFTPSSVVTSLVGDAFYKYWLLTKEKWVKEIIKQINEFLLYGLNKYYRNTNELCFSYTPLDRFYVHNANLFVSDFLLRTYDITKDERQLEMGQMALNYTLKQQNPDGSFYYHGYPGEVWKAIDHYHTGFVILSLKHIWEVTKEERIYQSFTKCVQYYLDELFLDGLPKLKPSSFYPVDIHSLAVAIITLVNVKGYDPRIPNYLESTLEFTIKEFQSTSGYFYYRIEKIGPIKWKVKFPYIRWAEAWMLYALTEYLRVFKSEYKLIS